MDCEDEPETRVDTAELVREIISRGATYVSGEYVNQDRPVVIRCSDCPREFPRTWRTIQRAPHLRCKPCADAIGRAKQAFTPEFVREDLAARGFELLEPYVNSQVSVRLRCLPREKCPGGVEFSNLYNNIRQRNVRTCPPCSRRRVGDSLIKPVSEVQAAFWARGAEPLFTEYRANNVALPFRCPTAGCENTHVITYSDLQQSKQKLLCVECSAADRPRGEKHHHWNPDLTPEEREDAGRPPIVQNWYRAVIARAGYRCVISGQLGGALAAHHMYAYATHPELRLDEANGVCLARDLHREFHGTYGHKCTYAQFAEFYMQKTGRDCPIADPLGGS